MDELIVDVRMNEYTMRDRNPFVPWSPEEIARDAAVCRDAGASIAHFHAREPETGAPSTDPELYCRIGGALSRACDIVRLPTLGAGVERDVDRRIAHVTAMGKDPATRAELAPLDLASTNISVYDASRRAFRNDDYAYTNTVKTLRALSEGVQRAGSRPYGVAWNVGSIRLLEPLVETGVLPTPLYVELTLTGGGILDTHPPTERGLSAFLDFMPEGLDVEWGVLCVGTSLLELAPTILERGGHLALGLGDHPYLELGDPPTNAKLVEHVVELGRAVGREPATPKDVRQRLGLAA